MSIRKYIVYQNKWIIDMKNSYFLKYKLKASEEDWINSQNSMQRSYAMQLLNHLNGFRY